MKIFLWALAIAFLAIGFVMTIVMAQTAIPAREADLLLAYLAFGGGAGLVVAVVIARASVGAGFLARGVVALLSLVGMMLVVGGLLICVNKFADASPGSAHVGKVVKKHIDDDNPDIYSRYGDTVSVTSWIDDGKLVRVSVTPKDARALQVGDAITVVAHEGRLGWAWTEPYRAQ